MLVPAADVCELRPGGDERVYGLPQGQLLLHILSEEGKNSSSILWVFGATTKSQLIVNVVSYRGCDRMRGAVTASIFIHSLRNRITDYYYLIYFFAGLERSSTHLLSVGRGRDHPGGGANHDHQHGQSKVKVWQAPPTVCLDPPTVCLDPPTVCLNPSSVRSPQVAADGVMNTAALRIQRLLTYGFLSLTSENFYKTYLALNCLFF